MASAKPELPAAAFSVITLRDRCFGVRAITLARWRAARYDAAPGNIRRPGRCWFHGAARQPQQREIAALPSGAIDNAGRRRPQAGQWLRLVMLGLGISVVPLDTA